MHTVQILNRLVEHHQVLTYFLIFLGLIFEGEVTLISAGVLSHLGALDFRVALVCIFAGGMVKTFLGYYIGQVLYEKFKHKKFIIFIERRVSYFIPRFQQKPFWSIFLSKFIMGVNYLVVIFSGYKRVNFKTYIKAEIIATLIWAPLLLSLGYFFSYTALHISRDVGRFLLTVISFTIIFLLADRLVGLVYELFENYKISDKINENK